MLVSAFYRCCILIHHQHYHNHHRHNNHHRHDNYHHIQHCHDYHHDVDLRPSIGSAPHSCFACSLLLQACLPSQLLYLWPQVKALLPAIFFNQQAFRFKTNIWQFQVAKNQEQHSRDVGLGCLDPIQQSPSQQVSEQLLKGGHQISLQWAVGKYWRYFTYLRWLTDIWDIWDIWSG